MRTTPFRGILPTPALPNIVLANVTLRSTAPAGYLLHVMIDFTGVNI